MFKIVSSFYAFDTQWKKEHLWHCNRFLITGITQNYVVKNRSKLFNIYERNNCIEFPPRKSSLTLSSTLEQVKFSQSLHYFIFYWLTQYNVRKSLLNAIIIIRRVWKRWNKKIRRYFFALNLHTRHLFASFGVNGGL